MQDNLAQGVAKLTALCFHDLALLPGEEPPDPTVPVPRDASDNEIQNSVAIQVQNMRKEEVTDTGIEPI